MVALITVALVLFLLLIIVAMLNRFSKKSHTVGLVEEEIPKNLGVTKDLFVPMAEKLEHSMSSSFIENVTYRMEREHPDWRELDINWSLFELKRYFLMTGILKSVPMFSDKVDEVWHEMLMFTRDYEQFSIKFYGSFLHHTPNMEIEPIPGDRAFFDYVYLKLFDPTINSRILWGSFLKYPIKRELLNDFQTMSTGALLTKYFRAGEEWLEIKKYIISEMKNDLAQMDPNQKGIPRKPNDDLSYLLPAVVFLSFYEPEAYEDKMAEELQKTDQALGSGATTVIACHTSDDSGSGDSSCSSGSSCSSCGGGCSS
ncbi:hypothetical protein LS684_11350 [Cytobacillus spongiae]|uniref:hypothetical protein n=1 Tax=Cytobacillus spongiae TaxID=2901381 RepID=UPI001F3911A6|nr:hypothetical protein [Cytobacillus spongiae]UII54286.1 hypothetical protein LS684_11350 [Cytobacillus spongiae]